MSKPRQEITLSFHNANEISKGSSVRFLGVDVGYVKNVSLQKDHVNVTLETYPNMLHIPSGAEASILFTGLVGSKSIEIELPNKGVPIPGSKSLITIEPVRLKQALDAQNEIAQALQGGAENFTDFFGKQKSVEELQLNVRSAEHGTSSAISLLDNIQQISQSTEDKTGKALHGAISTLADFTQGSQEMENFLSSPNTRANISTQLQKSRALFGKVSTNIQTIQNQQALPKINRQFGSLAYHTQTLTLNAQRIPIKRWAVSTETHVTQIDAGISHAHSFLEQSKHTKPPYKAFYQVDKNIRTVNQQVIKASQKI
jgi:ABC-type transporter Mla subunit MlaD